MCVCVCVCVHLCRGTCAVPCTSVGEENCLMLADDEYSNESILGIHPSNRYDSSHLESHGVLRGNYHDEYSNESVLGIHQSDYS